MRKQTKLAVVLAAAALLAVTSASVVSAAGWVQEGAEWRYQNNSGDYVTDSMKKSGDTTFYLDENGYMAKDYFCEYNDYKYYFGSNGAMVKNTWVAIDPALVDNDGDKDVCWFYFQETGKAYKATNGVSKKKIDGKTYFFNEDGIMMTGWFNKNGDQLDNDNEEFITAPSGDDVYYCGEDGVARSGWLAYTGGVGEEYKNGFAGDLADRGVLYFYFNTSNFKREQGALGDSKEKTINGKKYRFADNGVMMSAWDYYEAKYDDLSQYDKDRRYTEATMNSIFKYYSGENDGHLVKKGWVYAVPAENINKKNYDDDESKYFYFDNSGIMTKGVQKKINGKYYVFNGTGIMKTGLVLLGAGNKFVTTIDLDYTNASDLIKKDIFYTDDPKDNDSKAVPEVFNGPFHAFVHANDNILAPHNYSGARDTYSAGTTIHYYGSDGARITGNNINIDFADDSKQFASKNSGGIAGYSKKKYYSNGFLLKASDDLKLGLIIATDGYARRNTNPVDGTQYTTNTINHGSEPSGELEENILVISATGSVKKKGAFKDADGNYWLTTATGQLRGIYDLQVKYASAIADCKWKSDEAKVVGSTKEPKDDQWLLWSDTNRYGETIDDHILPINNDYCLNFYLND